MDINSVCHIVGSGDFYPDSLILSTSDYLIAADGGYDYLQQHNIPCDLVIGDFDSILTKPQHKHVVVLPKEKDDTDMLAAIKYGKGMGFRRFAIHGGTGDRLDHVLGNIQILSFLAVNQCIGIIFSSNQNITAICNTSLFLPKECSGTISIFAQNQCDHVSIKGLKYEMDNGQLSNTYPVGVSNEFIGKESYIGLESGILIIMYEKQYCDMEQAFYNLYNNILT